MSCFDKMFIVKKKLLIIILMLGVLSCTHAQSIVGKWKCSKVFLQKLGFYSSGVRGRYKFKKDSTFVVKIYAENIYGMSIPRSLYIKASGTYTITNNKITTIVQSKDVKCNAHVDIPDPDYPKVGGGSWVREAIYDGAMAESDFREDMVRREKYFLWKWLNAPFTLTKDSLVIGGLIELRR